MTQKPLTRRIMNGLYYSLLGLVEEIDRADPSDRETLRALLALIDELRIPLAIATRGGGIGETTFLGWKREETPGDLLYIKQRRRKPTQKIVARLKLILQEVLEGLPRDRDPSLNALKIKSWTPEDRERRNERHRQQQAVRNRRRYEAKKATAKATRSAHMIDITEAVKIASTRLEELERACETRNSGPSTTASASTKSAPATSSSSAASATNAGHRKAFASTVAIPAGTSRPMGASGQSKS